jgi:endoglucanase
VKLPWLTSVTVTGLVLAAACVDTPTTPVKKSERLPDTTSTSTATTTTTSTPPADTTTSTTTTTAPTNPILGALFYVNPYSNAKKTADSWRSTRPADATQMDKIATQSQAVWFGGWSGDIYTAVNNATTTITSAGAIPVYVAYNIPQRDCGGFSSGGTTIDGYKSWITGFANGIGSRKAVVVLEPDALAAMDCLSSTDQQTRIDLIRYAVSALKSKPATFVYLDAGNSHWKSASTMADRLTRAAVGVANGFSLNVSNFLYTASTTSYGESISTLIGGKHFLVDTSRNGLGPTSDYQWCNPSGRGLGYRPSTMTSSPLIDAFLWVKAPGESDGTCNGGPTAGAWWADYALGLAQRG